MTNWARLVDQLGNPLSVFEDEVVIGRAKECNISLAANRLVSGRHCRICKDSDGKVWLADTSTNGTLVNNYKVTNGQKVQLSSGDVIRVVFKRDDDRNNVTYRFEDLRQDEAQTLELTQEYDEDDTIITTEDTPTKDVDSTADNPAKSDFSGEPPAKVARLEGDSKDVLVSSKEQSAPEKDVMEETLMCGICQEILHECVSLQPCMHSFCAGCYSQWMERSKDCPHCRGKVQRVSKNHIVNNLVDAYLKAHPEKRRSDDDLKELDARNKITDEMIYPKRKRRQSDDEYSDEEDSDEDADTSDADGDYPTAAATSSGFTVPGGLVAFGPPPPMKCRQCPGYSGPTTIAHASVISPATCSDLAATASSDAADRSVINPPPYTCPVPALHVLCHCCMQPMPNRAAVVPSDAAIPKQKCDVCCQSYCHLYWGCNSPNCRGCLGSFSDINLADHHLNGILNNGNVYESDILKDYLKAKGLGIGDVLQDCVARLDSGEYHFSVSVSTAAAVRSDTTICYRCCLKTFQELVFSYRKDIPVADLPAEVVSRPDCYWGKNCRTQHNKPHHARHFNHICDQTRF